MPRNHADKIRRINYSDSVNFRAFSILGKFPYISSISPVRVKNRCVITGRSRAVLREFKVSRIVVRESFYFWGLKKSSW